ncbi:ligand-binding sensor domain-containing protein [Ferruginibacter sp.]
MQRSCVIIFFLLCWFKAQSQDNPYIFSHLDEENGLSNNIVNCFLKDSKGRFWIGTYNGLNRFDGSNFYSYKKKKNSNSILNEVVQQLCEDKNGNLWGATDAGLFCYQPGKDNFINYPIRQGDSVTYFGNIACDSSGNIWATNHYFVFRYDPVKNQFDNVFKTVVYSNQREGFRITKNGLIVDASGKGLWLATEGGIMYYDISKNELLNFATRNTDSLFAKRATSAMSMAPDGNIWFSDNSRKALVSFNPSTKKIVREIGLSKELPPLKGTATFEDKDHRLWYSNWERRVLVVDLSKGNKIEEIVHDPQDKGSITAQFFWAVYQDDDGTIWLGTHSGISLCNPYAIMYKRFHLKDKVKELNGSSIYMAEENAVDKSIWIMTSTAVIIHYFPETGKYTTYDFKQAAARSDGTKPGIVNMVRFLKDRIIITTETGAWQILNNTNKITPYNFLPASFRDFKCCEFANDADSLLYFNDGRQVLQWNCITGTTHLLQFSPEPDLPKDGTLISGIMVSPDRTLWCKTLNGAIAFKNNNYSFTTRKLTSFTPNEIGYFTGMTADVNKNVWVIKHGIGIIQYNAVNNKIQVLDEEDGLLVNRMQHINTDRYGRLWSVYFNKVSVYIPETNRFLNFILKAEDGELNYNSYLSKLANGNLLAAADKELFELIPGRINVSPVSRAPQISQMKVGSTEINVFASNKIVLKPDENTIRFRFGYNVSKEIFPYDLLYKLEGAETAWTTAGENHEALYNNLPPGDYKFMVEVRGRNKTWKTEDAVLSFTIATPYYKSSWFLIGILLFSGGLLFFIYRYRVAQKEKLLLLESKTQLLEKEKALVMYENLKQHLNPHFLFNSLTSLSSLIRLDQRMAGDFLDKMSKVYRYILKNRDNEVVPISEELKFVQMYIDLQQTRFEKGLQVHMRIDEEYLHRKIAPVTLQNLVENAIKHNTVNADSPLIIELFVEDNCLVVQNNLQKKKFVETSNRQGLANMQSLYRYLGPRPMEILETDKYFIVKIPLI